tara:strand:+ start:2266 stop:3435 length:1170 start_codon:yes stop_codon:yes gene_type:complete
MEQKGGVLKEIYGEGKGFYKDMRTTTQINDKRKYVFTIGKGEKKVDINKRIDYFREGSKYYKENDMFNKPLWEEKEGGIEKGISFDELFKEYGEDNKNEQGRDIAYFENITLTQERLEEKTDGKTLLFIPFMIHFSSFPDSMERILHVTMETNTHTIKPYSMARKDEYGCKDQSRIKKVHFGFDKKREGKIGFFKADGVEAHKCITKEGKRDMVRAFIYSMFEIYGNYEGNTTGEPIMISRASRVDPKKPMESQAELPHTPQVLLAEGALNDYDQLTEIIKRKLLDESPGKLNANKLLKMEEVKAIPGPKNRPTINKTIEKLRREMKEQEQEQEPEPEPDMVQEQEQGTWTETMQDSRGGPGTTIGTRGDTTYNQSTDEGDDVILFGNF